MYLFDYLNIGICVYLALKSRDGSLDKRQRWLNMISIVFLLLCVRGTLQQLGWLLGHLGQAQRLLAVRTPIIPLEVNWLFLVGQLIFGPMTMALCFFLSQGNDKARLWILRILAILYLNTSFDFFLSFTGAETEWSNKAVWGLLISSIACGIPYYFVYRFYSNPKVIDSIFSKPKTASPA